MERLIEPRIDGMSIFESTNLVYLQNHFQPESTITKLSSTFSCFRFFLNFLKGKILRKQCFYKRGLDEAQIRN